MIRGFISTLLGVLILVVGLASTAEADRRKAEKLFRSGERAYRAQNFISAAQFFELSYKELNAPELAFSAAQAYRRAYRVDPTHTEYIDKSINFYELYLKAVKKGGRVGDAADALGQMVTERARLGGGSKTGVDLEKATMLGVSVQLADHQEAMKMQEVDEDKHDTMANMAVKLFIDGKPRELDTLHPVDADVHTIRVEAPGYEPLEKRVKVIAGAPVTEEVTLQPKPAQVTVTTEPGASIIVDGRGIGTAPLAAIPMAAGSHVITIVRTGRRPAAREVVVTRAQTLSIKIPLESTTRRRSVKWVAIASGVSVGMVGFFGLAALYGDNKAEDALHDLQQTGDQDPSTLERYNDGRDLRDLSVRAVWISSGTAVALGLTAAWLYYFDTPSAAGVKVVPLATAEGGGAAMTGRF